MRDEDGDVVEDGFQINDDLDIDNPEELTDFGLDEEDPDKDR